MYFNQETAAMLCLDVQDWPEGPLVEKCYAQSVGDFQEASSLYNKPFLKVQLHLQISFET